MRILVIDDTPVHLKQAQEQLGGEHELVLCDNADKAFYILQSQAHENKEFCIEPGYYDSLNRDMSGVGTPIPMRKGMKGGEYMPLQKFDAVLCDLMMPGLLRQVGGKEKYMTSLDGMGYPLALLALRAGVKHVGILTNSNHHDNPMASFVDGLRGKTQLGEQTLFISDQYIDRGSEGYFKKWNVFLADLTTPSSGS